MKTQLGHLGVKCALLLVSIALAAGLTHASTILCTEDVLQGCQIQLPVDGTNIWVFSDGLVPLPLSDLISFSDAGWIANMDPSSPWVECDSCGFSGSVVSWVLPESSACSEGHDQACEPIGSWYLPGAFWTSSSTFIILEEDGDTVSDIITVDNNGPGGSAEVLFNSAPTPEPSTLVLLGCGLLTVIGSRRRRSRR